MLRRPVLSVWLLVALSTVCCKNEDNQAKGTASDSTHAAPPASAKGRPAGLSPAANEPQRPAPARAGATEGKRCEALAKLALQGKPAVTASGKPIEPAGLREAMRDIYECHVVLTNDEKKCELVEPRVRSNCKALFQFFQAARKADADSSWPEILGEAMRYDCMNAFNEFSKSTCNELVDAIKAQKPGMCPKSPAPLQQICAAVASADPKLCAGDDDCEELAGRLALLKGKGGGLERIAKESTRRDRIHARAALGQASACEEEAAEFIRACRKFGEDR